MRPERHQQGTCEEKAVKHCTACTTAVLCCKYAEAQKLRKIMHMPSLGNLSTMKGHTHTQWCVLQVSVKKSCFRYCSGHLYPLGLGLCLLRSIARPLLSASVLLPGCQGRCRLLAGPANEMAP